MCVRRVGGSMIAGDFLEVYKQSRNDSDGGGGGEGGGICGAVLTCFFLDTAHNIVRSLSLSPSLPRPASLSLTHSPGLSLSSPVSLSRPLVLYLSISLMGVCVMRVMNMCLYCVCAILFSLSHSLICV